MPNHCSNRVTVTGPNRLVLAFIKKAATDKEPLEFNNLHPCPQELRDVSAVFGDKSPEAKARIKKYGFANWYDWCCENWSTKWGAYDAGEWCGRDVKSGPVSYSLEYQTAWAPASAFWKTVSKMFPKLSFKQEFAECGMCFVGCEVWEKGELTEEVSYDWSSKEGKQLAAGFGYEDETSED